MAHLIDKSALVAEIEKIIDTLIKNSGCIGAFGEIQITVYESVLSLINSLEVKEVDLDAYTKVSKALSVAFMQFLDNIRPEGKMCLSNAECSDIEKAFAMMDYSKLLRYLEKYSKIKAQKGESV